MSGAATLTESTEESMSLDPIELLQTRIKPVAYKTRRFATKRERRMVAQSAPPPDNPPDRVFRRMLARLGRYRAKWGDANVPGQYWEDDILAKWVGVVRTVKRWNCLTAPEIDALENLGFTWTLEKQRYHVEWDIYLHELRRYKEEYGTLAVPLKWRDPTGDFSNHLAKWYHAQPSLFTLRRLTVNQVLKLRAAGYDVSAAANDPIGPAAYEAELTKAGLEPTTAGTIQRSDWDVMYDQLQKWVDLYDTAVVPSQVHDNAVLGAWVHNQRKLRNLKRMSEEHERRLNELHFAWHVDVQASQWHHLLHETRRFKEAHGHARIPHDYSDFSEVGWVEAARWLQKNAKLFLKDKLPEKKYALIRDVLGIKFVKQFQTDPLTAKNKKSASGGTIRRTGGRCRSGAAKKRTAAKLKAESEKKKRASPLLVF
ncbi:hypothetical protein WJX81_001289 [Elliptochloris bilobata]|uniref:Helicase-associated domain-containing protein n=1 Tax=Elliptochloris bilobata TaxID=381761 RepID=A0AAW1SCE8_9CHLO